MLLLATVADKWENVSLAAAFLIGAVLATIAVLRIARVVMMLYEDGPRRRVRRKRLPEEEDPDEPDR